MKITRATDYRLDVEAAFPSQIYANAHIDLEKTALVELESFSQSSGLQKLVFTADFHKGAGVPIGTSALIDRVYPKLPGYDQGCGIRLDVIRIKNFDPTDFNIQARLRHSFFQGGREIFIKDRSEALASGLEANLTGYTLEYAPKINRAHAQGVLGQGEVSDVLSSYLKLGERENFLGTVGAGNHFVEIQQVDQIVDPDSAYHMGVRLGDYCVMVHSGSIEIGHQVGMHFADQAKKLWTGPKPANGLYSLPENLNSEYIRASYNAANFAMLNRMVMASMVAHVLGGQLESVYDSPHNLIWQMSDGYLHRKGSCPAAENEPVMIPGSMGTRSLLAKGMGFADSNQSSPHGAGRVLNRNGARHADRSVLDRLNLVTKIDTRGVRSDIVREVQAGLLEEAPRAYKDIDQVADSVRGAGIAKPVAWLKPLLTIKG